MRHRGCSSTLLASRNSALERSAASEIPAKAAGSLRLEEAAVKADAEDCCASRPGAAHPATKIIAPTSLACSTMSLLPGSLKLLQWWTLLSEFAPTQ